MRLGASLATFRRLAALLALGLVGACTDVMRDQNIAGRYNLVAIDLSENTIVCFRPDNAWCVGEGLPGPAVYAAGANDRYIAFARHPFDIRSPSPDRSVTEFYYIIREPGDHRQGKVVGPLDATTYRTEAARLSLPEFSISIDSLK